MYRVLIVDDEKSIREYLPQVIPWDKHGFGVCGTAQNGQEALARLPALLPDLILLDVRMPVMDGLAFLEELRKSPHRDTQVIMLSGYSDFSYAKEAIKFDVKAYLTKPVEENELYAALQEARARLNTQARKKEGLRFQKDMEVLRSGMNGAAIDPAQFRQYVLLTAVVLRHSLPPGEAEPGSIMHACLVNTMPEEGGGLVAAQGYSYLFLIKRPVLAAYANQQAFLLAVLAHFMALGLDCALCLDDEALKEADFLPAYKRHMHRMQTLLFYDGRRHLIYGEDGAGEGEMPPVRSADLTEALLHGDEKQWQAWLKGVCTHMRAQRMGHQWLQAVTDRLYYALTDALQYGAEAEPPFEKPVLREEPHFLRMDAWKSRMWAMLDQGHADILAGRRMQGMGITRDIVAYVRRNFTKAISLKQVAATFFINTTYLGQAFHKATGMPFKQYVTELRIKAAKQLLLDTDLRVYEIAEQVGYPESKYFVVKFEEIVGISPTEYRKGR